MSHRFHDIAFTPGVRRVQSSQGSRSSYARFEDGTPHHEALGPTEAGFIAARDSFYLATVSETGWPYVQHRGGPAGFLRVLGEKTLGFADFAGNRQYISVGNLAANDRVALFLMDYPNRTRLKILGRARILGDADGEPARARLAVAGGARVERGIVVTVEAFDWNCSQHITGRYTVDAFQPAVETLQARVAELERDLAAARGATTPRRG